MKVLGEDNSELIKLENKINKDNSSNKHNSNKIVVNSKSTVRTEIKIKKQMPLSQIDKFYSTNLDKLNYKNNTSEILISTNSCTFTKIINKINKNKKNNE